MRTFLQGNPTVNATIASLMVVALLAVTYFVFEPMVSLADSTSTFTVKEQITSEIAFQTAANNVVMTPSIQGLTGGNAFGTSTFVINTNNAGGYHVDLTFSSTTAMHGDGTTTSSISNYAPVSAGTPDYAWSVPAHTGMFGFTAYAKTTPSDVDAKFKNNGSACNTGTGTALGKCWFGAADATSPVTIINRPNATPGTGATSTLVFQVGVTSNPSPAIQTGYYTATATLTAITNP